ncbi:MAG TPA: ATP-dependent metallopeptidase FtsH/Yme1/Tma family protein, partial [Rubricoccaceae bacterium]|nr:ATP-dependent metallopeptidase FtsH/Yme1/Tma family protein [Rubricoccaceae bacterium]
MPQPERDPLNPRTGDENPRLGPRRPRFPLWVVYVVLLVGLLAVQALFWSGSSGREVDYSAFLDQLRRGYVEEVSIVDNVRVRGLYTAEAVERGLVRPATPPRSFRQEAPERARRRFSSTKPSDHDLSEYLNTINAERERAGRPLIEFKAEYTDSWIGTVLNWVFLLGLLLVFWWVLFRRMGGPGQQVLNIGKNKAVLFEQNDGAPITFKEVAGLDEAKEEVVEVVEFLKNP